jgi:TPR repeat protein
MDKPSDAAIAQAVVQDSILKSALQYLKDQGFVLPRDGVVAREWCEAEAKLGIVEAQVVFGQLTRLGVYGEQDAGAGKYWYQCAADKQHPAAVTLLAAFVEIGSDSESPNPGLAVSMLERAIEMEYAPAMSSMAVSYLHGIHVEKDRDRAMEYLRMAANLGDAQSQHLFAAKLLKEKSADAVEEGVRWMKTSAEQGHSGAHRQLGYFHMDGSYGMEQDQEKSEYHFSTALKIEKAAVAEIGGELEIPDANNS